MTTEVLLVAAGALCVSVLAVPCCMALAHRLGVMDRPGPLKTQESPVPYLGGVAVFGGLLIGGSAGRPLLLVPLAGALVIGVSDDRFGLPAPLRLVMQILVGVLIATIQPLHLSGWLGGPLVVVASILLINGFNLLDGLDMLAAGVAAFASAGFAVLNGDSARLLASSLVGALIGFLWFNRPPARIYLGDGGSYLLGAALTVFLAGAWGVGVPTEKGVIALALLIVPVSEVACAVVRRRRSRRSLMTGDRAHPYDLLVARGWSRLRASTLYIVAEGAAFAVTLVAVLGHASVIVAVGIDVAMTLVIVGAVALVGGFNAAPESIS